MLNCFYIFLMQIFFLKLQKKIDLRNMKRYNVKVLFLSWLQKNQMHSYSLNS